jgi:hypothetical protein
MAIEWNKAFNPEISKKFPSFKGIDFQTGKTVDLANYFKPPATSFDPGTKENLPSTYPSGSPYGDLMGLQEQIAAFENARDPYLINRYRTYAQIASEQQLQQMGALMPLQRYAGDIAEQRAIRAGMFRQQSPENVQNIMASKQSQMASAAAGEAARAQAMADQQRAASLYGGPFAGQFVRFGVG